ncbi:hypothetical protein B0H34DRAFT_428925 [Crassisporium funariophilum]|nr:hypothetical protein B0H34DRAFT_428925 [Crassisporium funariophilum]
MFEDREQSLRPIIAFISGPMTQGPDYFSLHYKPKIDAAIAAGHSFIMGLDPGMDLISLKYLVDQGVDLSRITVYLTNFEYRIFARHIRWYLDLGGKIQYRGINIEDRDAAMTRESDYDILRYMTIDEQKEHYEDDVYHFRVSTTETNERRRLGLPLKPSYPSPPNQDNAPAGWRWHVKKVLWQLNC